LLDEKGINDVGKENEKGIDGKTLINHYITSPLKYVIYSFV